MSLPQAIKTMLQGVAGVANTEVTYGTRNQFAKLPAITYLITSNDTVAINKSLKQCKVTINSVNQTAESAQAIAELVELQLVAGTYNTIVFQAVLNQNSILQESFTSLGDETSPFVCITTADIFYKE